MMNLVLTTLRLLCLFTVLAFLSCSGLDRDPDISKQEMDAGLLLREGKFQEGFDAFMKLRKLYPGSYIPLRGLAHASAMLGNSDVFEFYAMEACTAAPTTPTAHSRLGAMYISAAERFRLERHSRQYAELGCIYLSQALAADRDIPQAPYNLGVGFFLLGRDTECERVMQDVLRREPGRLEAMQVLLSVYRRTKKAAAARELLDPLVQTNRLPAAWKPIYDWAHSGS